MSKAETKSSLKQLLVSQKDKVRPVHDNEVVSGKHRGENGREGDASSDRFSVTDAQTPSSPASMKEINDIKLESAENGKGVRAVLSSSDRIGTAAGADNDINKLSSLLSKKRRNLQLGDNSKSSSREKSSLVLSEGGSWIGSDVDGSHVARDNIEPGVQLNHQAANHGKVIASHNDSQSVSTKFHELNPILLIGLPLFGCLTLALILYLAVKYKRRLKQINTDKCHGLNDTSSGSATNGSSPLTNVVSNGKLFGANTKPDLIKRANELRQKKAADCHQLTINMDGDCGSNQPAPDDSGNPQIKNNVGQKPTSNIKSLGALRYRLSYDFNQSILSVSILEACNLPGMDLNGYSDPYVKVYLTPKKSLPAVAAEATTTGASALQVDNQQAQKSDSVCYRTRIHKRTLNPVFNETFKFYLAYAELANKTLIMSMFDYDRLSKHDDMGQVSVAMDQIDLAQGQDEWAELRKTNEQLEERLGDICLSLRYVPSSGKLTVVILQARQLKRMDVAGLSDPYVKLALMNDQGKRLKKKKTSIKKFTLNPHYNESFSFEIPFDQIQQVQLVVSVVDYDRIGTSEPIGKITLGCGQQEGSTELRHWMDMLASPRRPIAQWHTLKDINLDGRISSSSGSGSSVGSATS